MNNLLKEKIRLLEELNGKQGELIKNIERQRECYGLEYATLFGNAIKLRESIATLTEQINAEPVNSHCRRSHTDKMGRHKTVEKPEPVSNPVAYEFHNLKTGHCYVDYIRRSDIEQKGGGEYVQRPLIYG